MTPSFKNASSRLKVASAEFKVATFNVWHGLAGRGTFRFREFESKERRVERFGASLRILSDLDPDVLLLQELNPVSSQGEKLTDVLGGSFLGRVDQAGLKVFSRGLPVNLATGLGTVIRKSVQSARERHDELQVPPFVRLSGGVGFSGFLGLSGEQLSFHLDEQRFAQFRSVQHAKFGRLLIANLHLHHGFEHFQELRTLLDLAVHQQRIAERDVENLLPYLEMARDRRLREIDRLLEVVHTFSQRHDGVVVGGDLNSTDRGAAYLALISDGFTDLAVSSVAKKWGGDGPTWDPEANFENHRIQREVGFDFPLPHFGNPELTNIYRAFDLKPRRIDFLFVKGSLAEVEPVRVERFGFPEPRTGLAPSDHFGLIATFDTSVT